MAAFQIFEDLQNVPYPLGSDSIARFLARKRSVSLAELHAIWKTSIKLDLQDRTVLEGEVLISHICADLRLHS